MVILKTVRGWISCLPVIVIVDCAGDGGIDVDGKCSFFQEKLLLFEIMNTDQRQGDHFICVSRTVSFLLLLINFVPV